MSKLEIRINGLFSLGDKLCKGAISDIYLGTNIQSGKEVAIKLQLINKFNNFLFEEIKKYKELQGSIHIPTVFDYGKNEEYNFLIMDLLGPNLQELFEFCNHQFSLKTVLMMLDQFISLLEQIHFKTYVYSNIKPENFAFGLGKKGKTLFVYDFFLMRKYRDTVTQNHIQYKENVLVANAIRFASRNTLKGIQYTRRDDFESLGYMMIYFLKGSLP